jgi:hypothetical protein
MEGEIKYFLVLDNFYTHANLLLFVRIWETSISFDAWGCMDLTFLHSIFFCVFFSSSFRDLLY